MLGWTRDDVNVNVEVRVEVDEITLDGAALVSGEALLVMRPVTRLDIVLLLVLGADDVPGVREGQRALERNCELSLHSVSK